MNIVDIVIILLIALGAYRGYKRGLLNALGGLFGWVISLIVAFTFNSNFKAFLDKQFNLTPSVGSWMGDKFPLPAGFEETNSSPQEIQQVVEALPMPAFMQDIMVENIAVMGEQEGAPENLSHIFGYGIAEMLIAGLAFLLLFFLVSLIIKFILGFLTKGLSLTPLGGLNRLGGLVIGGAVYSLILAIIAGVIYPYLMTTDTALSSQIKASGAVNFLINIFGQISSFIF